VIFEKQRLGRTLRGEKEESKELLLTNKKTSFRSKRKNFLLGVDIHMDRLSTRRRHIFAVKCSKKGVAHGTLSSEGN